MTSYDAAVIAYLQGHAAGRTDEREELMTTLSERVDELEATWQPVERRPYTQKVAERVAEMEQCAADFSRRAQQDVARHALRDAQNLRTADKVAGPARCRSCGGQMQPTPSGLCNPRCPVWVKGSIGDPGKPFTTLDELADRIDPPGSGKDAAA